MAHVIQLGLGAFMSSLRVMGRTKSWEAHERDQHFGGNKSIDIGQRQRLWKEGNARINKVLAMRSGLAKIIEKVRISWYFESPETDLYIPENKCCIEDPDTWWSKRVDSLSKRQIPHRRTTDYRWEDTLELNSGVARLRIPITRHHLWVAPKSTIQWLPTTLHMAGWKDHCQVRHGSFEAIPILHPVDVN